MKCEENDMSHFRIEVIKDNAYFAMFFPPCFCNHGSTEMEILLARVYEWGSRGAKYPMMMYVAWVKIMTLFQAPEI